MVQRVIAAGKKVGCPTGIHAMDPQSALERAEQGMRFIAVGSELRFMTQKAQEVLEVIRPAAGKKDIARY
jgi:4-hydroxy-2-oxoheptanedioate aldolase